MLRWTWTVVLLYKNYYLILKKLNKRNNLTSCKNRLNMSDKPTPCLTRQFTNSSTYCIPLVLPAELVCKLGDKRTLSVFCTTTQCRQSIGFYDKNTGCMMLNGEASLLHYMNGEEITLTNWENMQWIDHIIRPRD